MKTLFLIHITVLLSLNSCTKQEASNSSVEKTRYKTWIEDINYFEHEFLNNAKTYTKEAKNDCKVILENLKTEINSLTDFQIRLALSKCVVLADNAHTESPLPLMDKIPLRFYRFSDGIHVVKTDSIASKYLGSKVIKINTVDVNQVERSLFPYLTGIEGWKKFKALDFIAAPKILNELGLGKKDSITLTLVKNKDTLDVSFDAKKVAHDRPWFKAWSNLYAIPNQKDYWNFVKNDKESLPLYLKHAEEGVFYLFDDRHKIAYFHINSFWDKRSDFKDIITAFDNELRTKNDYNVVVDLRFYTGGDYGLFTSLATKPPKIIDTDKKIYLITSNKTYSAGIVTAARVKHYAKDKIIIVGEEVGDRLKFWAEGELVKLPNSGIRIYNAKKEHDWKNNKHSIFKTHTPNFIYGVAAKNLKLDKEIQLSFKDYIEDRDPVLEWIINQ